MWKSPLKLPKKLSLAARFILLAPALAQISAHAQTAPTNYASQALSFYQNRKFNQSADAFELAMRGTTPEPRLYYYAALANKEARRLDRAKQILAYICKYFAKSADIAGQEYTVWLYERFNSIIPAVSLLRLP